MKQQTATEKLLFGKEELQPLLPNEQRDSNFLLDEKSDKYRIVYWIYILYGITSLLPWNVFITASGYFTERFTGTVFEETFQNYFSTYFTGSNLIAYILIICSQNSSYRLCFDPMVPIITNTLIFTIMTVTVKLDFMNGNSYFYFVMVLIVLSGISTSLFQNAVFSEASQLPPIYLQAVLGGQGIAGIIVSVTSIASILLPTASTNASALIYFIVASLLSISALIGRLCISHNAFYRSQMLLASSAQVLDDTTVSIRNVLYKSGRFAFSICYLFVVTIMVFPSVTSLVKPINSNIDSNLFTAFHFLIFNVGDWIGRMLPIYHQLVTSNIKRLVSFSLLRTVFIPLFLMCHIIPRSHTPIFAINSDTIFLGLCWLFALTNGWLCSLVMMAAPQSPSIREDEKAMVGSIMSFVLVLGLALGGSLSFVTKLMV